MISRKNSTVSEEEMKRLREIIVFQEEEGQIEVENVVDDLVNGAIQNAQVSRVSFTHHLNTTNRIKM